MTLPAALDERFRARAARDGLLDVAYDYVDSPVGRLLVAATERGVCRISFAPEAEAEDELEELARRHGTRVLYSPKPLAPARRQLDAYFEGRRTSFDVPVDVDWLPAFQQQVLAELARVPFGRTATYGGLAALVGRPRAARAVGGALNRNPVPIVLPCHRVVGASGSLVGYAGGLERKRALLAHEGVVLA
jgi:methylated-DNA-[protein]-cysteine S-methyltransferase